MIAPGPSDTETLLNQFQTGPRIEHQWEAARQLMASKQLLALVGSTEFQRGLAAVGAAAVDEDGLRRLLAVDLIVRISSFAKKLKGDAAALLRSALHAPLPPLSLATETKALCENAKAAEIRENVALSLAHADGNWIVPYAIESLAGEDRSQRCRVELLRQVAGRDHAVDSWITQLCGCDWNAMLRSAENAEVAPTRLRDIMEALAQVVRERRRKLTVSERAGSLLAELCGKIIQMSATAALPKKLKEGAAATLSLVDEILAIRLTLVVEPDVYAPISIVRRWWHPLPYPPPLREALAPLIDKLIGAITLRARLGQKSEALVLRLRDALADDVDTKQRLAQIAQSDAGLASGIEDWLLGIDRTQSARTTRTIQDLQSVGDRALDEPIAKLLLEVTDVTASVKNGELHRLPAQLDRLALTVFAIANQRGLELSGTVGEHSEYSPALHETASGAAPGNPIVKIVRPMVLRRRQTGGQDVVLRAVVSDV